MSWNIQDQDEVCTVTLAPHMRIQNAIEFHRALIPVVRSGKRVRIDASRSESIHTTVMQILHSLSLSATSFEIAAPSAGFLSAVFKAGLIFPTKSQRTPQSEVDLNAPASMETEVNPATT